MRGMEFWEKMLYIDTNVEFWDQPEPLISLLPVFQFESHHRCSKVNA